MKRMSLNRTTLLIVALLVWIPLCYCISSLFGTKGGGAPAGFGSEGLSLLLGWFFMAPCLFFAAIFQGAIDIASSEKASKYLTVALSSLFAISLFLFFVGAIFYINILFDF